MLDNFERNAPAMTPERVGAAMQRLFTGSGPRMLVTSPEAIEGGAPALAEGLAAARAAAPATRAADAGSASTICRLPGRPGREVSRQRIDDMDVTIVRFANGSTLTFKHTDFERGIGPGPAALRPRPGRAGARPAVARLARPG